METTVLNPQYVYVQTTEPSDKTAGKLWYNTTAKALYSSDGTNYKTMEIDTTEIQTLIQENAINILINSAGATTTLNDWDTMEADIFTDSDGYLDTIDTGNTTAVFSSDKYTTSSNTADENSITGWGNGNTTYYRGFDITATNNCNLVSATKESSCTATKCYIYNASNELLGTATFSGDIATFSNVSLTASVSYRIGVGKDGAYYMGRSSAGQSYPIAKTNITYTGACANIITGGNNDCAYNLLSITTSISSDSIVQTNTETITANPTAHQVYCKNTTTGTGTATYNISFDNGSTWVTNQTFNTKNKSVHNGTQLILKVNLNGAGAGNTAEAENYAVMLFY